MVFYVLVADLYSDATAATCSLAHNSATGSSSSAIDMSTPAKLVKIGPMKFNRTYTGAETITVTVTDKKRNSVSDTYDFTISND